MNPARVLLISMLICIGAPVRADGDAGRGAMVEASAQPGIPVGDTGVLRLPRRSGGFHPLQLKPVADGPSAEHPLSFGRSKHQPAPPESPPDPVRNKRTAGAETPNRAASSVPDTAIEATKADSGAAASQSKSMAGTSVSSAKTGSPPAARPGPQSRPVSPSRDEESAALDRLREKLVATLRAHSRTAARVEADAGGVKVVAHGDGAAPPSGRQPARPALSHKRETKPSRETKPNRDTAHWRYEGVGGPADWGDMRPEWAACATGRQQSPIDIRGGVAVELPAIDFGYSPTSLQISDNGHTIRADVGEGQTLKVMGRTYRLRQFHFHHPAETRVDGRQYDMVAHLVHQDDAGRLAVVAVMFEAGGADAVRNPVVQAVWNNLPLDRVMRVPVPGSMDPAVLLPEDRRYFTFMGSLTTPPCTEQVLWMVMRQALRVPASQIEIFAHLYPMNARPVQPLGGRLIKQSE